MRYACGIVLIILCFFLVGCATTEPVDIPEKDCIIFSPSDGQPIIIRQGFFNDPNDYYTLEEFQAEYERWVKQQFGM